MKILLLGSGAREHALAEALLRDPLTSELIVAPGNPGIAKIARTTKLDLLDPVAIADFAEAHEMDLVVVAPLVSIVAGVVDEVASRGIPAFGPSSLAAAIEESKLYARDLLAAVDAPMPLGRACKNVAEVDEAMEMFGSPYVVKDVAIAAGKGVQVTESRRQALAYAESIFAKHDDGGRAVLVEEAIDGPEVCFSFLCDGHAVLPITTVRSYKRLNDYGEGPNTGGMGAYSPVDWIAPEEASHIQSRVAEPIVEECLRRGHPFTGLLTIECIASERGLRVIDLDIRFGDPETEVIVPRLGTSLASLLLATATGNLAPVELEWSSPAAVAVVVASEGYPKEVKRGVPIKKVPKAEEVPGARVYHGSTAYSSNRLVTRGGRPLTIVGLGGDFDEARDAAYAAVGKVKLDGGQVRTDVADGRDTERIKKIRKRIRKAEK